MIVCALAAELRGLRAASGVRVLETGVGAVDASIGTARALAEDSYDAVVSAGVAGTFRGRGRVGEAVLVARERFAGLFREDGSALVLPDGASICDETSADPRLIERCAPLGLRIGSGVTVTTVTASDETAARLVARYDCDVESMEGFAVLRAAQVAGVPAVQVRGVSNYAGSRATSEWDFSAGRSALVAALDGVLHCIGLR